MAKQVAVEELSVVDAAHDLGQLAEWFAGDLQGGDQGRDDRARTGARDTRKPVAGRGQRIDGPHQSNTANTAAFADQISRVHNDPLPTAYQFTCGARKALSTSIRR